MFPEIKRGHVPTAGSGGEYGDVYVALWMRPGGGGASGGSLRSSRQAVA